MQVYLGRAKSAVYVLQYFVAIQFVALVNMNYTYATNVRAMTNLPRIRVISAHKTICNG
jgi:hypothetical protein